MASDTPIQLTNGKVWSIGSMITSNTGEVIIPVDQLEGMDDAEIGRTVRACIRPARILYATEIALWDGGGLGPWEGADEESILEALPLMIEFKDTIPAAAHAYSVMMLGLTKTKRKREKYFGNYGSLELLGQVLALTDIDPVLKLKLVERASAADLPGLIELGFTLSITAHVSGEQEPSRTKTKTGWIYVLATDGGLYKIGRALDPVTRQKMLGTEIPTETKTVILEKVLDYISVESELHRRYADKRKRGEWFSLSADDLDAIRAYLLTLAIERIKA